MHGASFGLSNGSTPLYASTARIIGSFSERTQDQVELPGLHDFVTTTVGAALQPRQLALWPAPSDAPDRTATTAASR